MKSLHPALGPRNMSEFEERKEVTWTPNEKNLKNFLVVEKGKLMEFNRSTAVFITEQYRDALHVNLVDFVDKLLSTLPMEPSTTPYYSTQKRYPPIHHRLFQNINTITPNKQTSVYNQPSGLASPLPTKKNYKTQE